MKSRGRGDPDPVLRADGNLELQARMAVAIGKLFPGCPPRRAEAIARHAARAAATGWDVPPPAWALGREALELAALAVARKRAGGETTS